MQQKEALAEAVSRAERTYQNGAERLSQLPDLAALGGRSVCIAGCSGLIGSLLCTVLARANETTLSANPIQVYGIARHPSEVLPTERPGFTFVLAGVTDQAALSLLPECDYLVYIAGAASDYLSRVDQIIETQFEGLQAFLSRTQYCRGFVYVSSARVYGRHSEDTPLTEAQAASVIPMHLDNIYDASKRFGESLCLWHVRFGEHRACVARLANVYGAQTALRSETAITDFVRQALERRQIVLTGHPDSVRNYCSVLDIAQGILKALVNGKPGEAYNLGSREHFSSRQMAEEIAAVMPFDVPVQWPNEGVVPNHQRVLIEKAAEQIGYAPEHFWPQIAPYVVQKTAEGLGLSLFAPMI